MRFRPSQLPLSAPWRPTASNVYCEHDASENLPYAAPQTIAGHRAELEAGDDDPRPRVAQSIRAPGDIEVRSTPPAPLIPAGGEVRAARQTHAAREPFAR